MPPFVLLIHVIVTNLLLIHVLEGAAGSCWTLFVLHFFIWIMRIASCEQLALFLCQLQEVKMSFAQA
jgi:hypothetical protein